MSQFFLHERGAWAAHLCITLLTGAMLMLGAPGCGSPASQDTPKQGTTGIADIDQWTARIAENPDDHTLYAARAEAFLAHEGYDEAIRDLAAAIVIDSMNVGYHYALSDVYLRYFKSRLALQTLERAVAVAPDDVEALLRLARLQHTLKFNDESLQSIDRALRLDPQSAEAYFLTGQNFAAKGQTAAAITAFQKAVDLDPDLPDAWIALGRLYAQLGRPNALRFFESAIRVAPDDPVVYHAKADYLRDQDDLPGAIALYKQLNTIDPRYPDGLYNAGLLYMELDSVEQAYQHFDLATKVSVTHVRAYAFKALAAERLGRRTEAKELYEQALRFAPEYEMALEGLARVK